MSPLVQTATYGVWVKVDDGLGWRVVHEGESHDDAFKIATMMVVHKYPVMNIDLRELNGPTKVIYEYPGEMP